MAFTNRSARELQQLLSAPPLGFRCSVQEDGTNVLLAELKGPNDSAYAGGCFMLRIRMNDRYPIEPPDIRFITPVYHPNIDSEGRICLDLLKPGGWKPSLSICHLLSHIRLLLICPNPDDPLVHEIATELRENPAKFSASAKQWTNLHATNTMMSTSVPANPSTEHEGIAKTSEKIQLKRRINLCSKKKAPVA